MAKSVATKKKNTGKPVALPRWSRLSIEQMTIGLFSVLAVGALGVFLLRPTHASSVCVYNTYSYSTSYNSCTKYIQNMMDGLIVCKYNNCGSYSQIYAYPDGYFGSKTVQAVKDYQSAYNTKIGSWKLSVDGIVGKNTWTALCYPPSSWIPNANTQTTEYRQWSNAKYSAGCGYL